MYWMITSGIVAILFGSVFQAQTPLSIRAASEDPVPGWERMEAGNRVVWVAPTASLTAADIERARPIIQDGKRIVAIDFTDAGAEKMRKLSAAQIDKLIAMVLDGEVIWAPKVRGAIGKQGILTGMGPDGMSEAVIQRILASVGQR